MSNETKWAPGPWYVSSNGNISNTVMAVTGRWEFGDYSECVCLFQSALGPGSHKFRDEEENAKANAHLIAAAPELYEALEKLEKLARVSEDYFFDHAVDRAQKALAKARGESHD